MLDALLRFALLHANLEREYDQVLAVCIHAHRKVRDLVFLSLVFVHLRHVLAVLFLRFGFLLGLRRFFRLRLFLRRGRNALLLGLLLRRGSGLGFLFGHRLGTGGHDRFHLKQKRAGLVHVRENVADGCVGRIVFALGVERIALQEGRLGLGILGEQPHFPAVEIERFRSDVVDQMDERRHGGDGFLGHFSSLDVAGIDLLCFGIDASLKGVQHDEFAASGNVRADFLFRCGCKRLDEPIEVRTRAAIDIATAILGKRRILGPQKFDREHALEQADRGNRFVTGSYFQERVVGLDGLLILVEQPGQAMPGAVGREVVRELLVDELSELDGAVAVRLANAVDLVGFGVLDLGRGTEVPAERERPGEAGLAAGCFRGAGHVLAENRRLIRLIRDLIVVDEPQVHVGHIGGVVLRCRQFAGAFQQRDDGLLPRLDLVLVLLRVVLQVERAGHLNQRRHLAIFKRLELNRVFGNEAKQLEFVGFLQGLEHRGIHAEGKVLLAEQPANDVHALPSGALRVFVVRLADEAVEFLSFLVAGAGSRL